MSTIQDLRAQLDAKSAEFRTSNEALQKLRTERETHYLPARCGDAKAQKRYDELSRAMRPLEDNGWALIGRSTA